MTAGIDFALTLIAEVLNPVQAQAIQLIFETRVQVVVGGSPAIEDLRELEPPEPLQRVLEAAAELAAAFDAATKEPIST